MWAKTIYFKNTAGWSTVKCHHWEGGTASSWPGDDMTPISGTSFYEIEIDDSNSKVIFNNNDGSQTGDIGSGVTDGHVFVWNNDGDWKGYWGGSWLVTIYYAVPSATVGSYTVKVNVAKEYDQDKKEAKNYEQNDMTKIAGHYDGYDIYKGVFYDVYEGAGTIQFQLYNGGSYVSQQQPIGSWTGISTYSGKLYKHNVAGWNTLAYDHTANVSAGSNGSVSPSGASTTINVSGTSITATPDSHYAFTGWTISGGGISPSSSTTSPQTFTATSDGGSIQANFAPKWAIKGGDTDSSDGTSDKMGNWSTYNNFASTGEANMYSQTITLDANETYRFKVIERGGTDTYYGYGTDGSNNDLTFIGQSGSQVIYSGNNHNLVLMTAGAGSYTFTWNSNRHALEVTYPTVDHPCSDYVYFKDYYNWDADHGDILAHIWGGSSGTGSNNMPHVGSFTFDGTTYYYAALGDNDKCMFAGSDNTSTYKTEDLNSAGSKTGKYYDVSSANSEASRWQDFKVLITLDNQAATSAGTESVNPIYKSTVLSDISVPSKDNYTFGGYYTGEGGSGTQLINASGVWQAQSGYTDASKHWTRKESVTLYAKWTQTVTLSHTDASSGPSNPTVTYNTIPADITLPVRSGYGFDGYWTESGGNGIQVIDETGKWKKDVAYHTDANGKWTRSDATTLYARWLPNGYYMVGGFNNWTADPSYHKFDGTTNKVSFGLSKSDFTSTPIKVRKVNENTSTWYGKGASDGDNSIGKATPSITGLTSTGARITLQVYYTGTYEFEMSEGDGTIDLTVTVPVVNRLEFYNINGYTDGNTDDPVEGHDLPWLTDNFSDVDANTVTKTETLHRGSYYYFKPVYDSEYYGKGTGEGNNITITRNTNTTVSDLDDDGSLNTLRINADLTGDYTFNFNHSTKTLTVTYPTKRIINYSAVTLQAGTGESAAPTAKNNSDADYALASKDSVVSGNSVTFSAKTANPGYTFRGWFSKNNPTNWTDGLLEDDADYTVTIDADKTVYAVYSEDTLTVTVTATTGGSITTPSGSGSTVSAHPATKADIVAAKADEGWHFTGWSVESGSATFDDQYALTTKVTTTENATIQANFVRRYALYGSRDNGSDPNTKSGLPGWYPEEPVDFTGTVTTLGTADGANLTYAATLEPNKKYKFQVYDRALSKYRGASADDAVLPAEANPSAGIYNNWELNAGTPKDVHIYTVGYGTYTFHITKISNDGNYYPSIQVDRQSSKQLTLGKKVIYNDDNSSLTNADTEGTVTAKVVENEPETLTPTDYFLTSGQYYADGSDITFAAEAATGYKIVGWYSDVSCSTPYEHDGSTIIISGDETESTLVLKNCTTAKTVYVKFAEKMTTVRLVILDDFSENPGVLKHAGSAAPSSIKVGVHTTYTLTAEADSIRGFYFSKWYKQFGEYSAADFSIDYDDELHPSIIITGLGGGVSSNQNLSASFNYLKKIYFRNVNETTGGKLWDADQIYVYFDCEWRNSGNVSGVNKITHHLPMTVENTFLNIYSAYVPRWFTRKVNSDGKGSVAFSKEWMGTGEYPNSPYSEFFGNHGVYRTDYNTNLNMYVPACTQSNADPSQTNGTTYYNNGYWKNYYNLSNRGQGYYLKKWTANNTYRQIDEFVAENSDYDPILKCALRVDNTSRADSNYYRITSAGGENYTCVTITNAACTNVNLLPDNSNNSYFVLTPTVEGEYLITIDQTGDTMKISVNYPIAVGDYRLKHSYNDGSAQTSYSDIIKSYQAADDTVSMFIYAVDGEDAGTEIDGSLVLQRCTAITDGKPVWSAGNAVSAYTIANFNKGAGVYKFAVVINTSDHAVTSATDIDLYKGPFYIKTDGADGGWVNYKQNILDKNEINFSREDASTFDYYFCHFYSAGRAEVAAGTYAKATNIKCVIANDYNNAVSDTLIGDDILGVNTGDGNKPYETLPYQGSVRFSYNSATNEVKRTYLDGSSGSAAFLYLVAGKDNYIYTSVTKPDVEGDDVYNRDKNNRKFTDRQNWIYEFTVYAYPTATAGVTTEYDSKTQELIPSTNLLIGGSEKGDYKYMMKLVYDFKTNYIMSAFTPAGDIETEVKDVDVLLVRQGQGAATTITFAKDGKGAPTGSLKSQKIIGALRFSREQMQGKVSDYAANRNILKYFVSFPFDVRVRDIFGINSNYGDAYVVSRYAGDKRAAKGFFRGDGTSTFWEELTLDSVMHANVGYVVILDNDYFNGDIGNLWAYNPPEIYLYFPSTDSIGAITPDQAITIDVPQHECKINRSFIDSYTSKEVNHKFTDTDWNLMGVPVFTTFTGNKEGAQDFDPGKLFVKDQFDTITIAYFYNWDTITNEFSIQKAHDYVFKPMHSYMVQYHGKVTFVGTAHVPAAVAARRTPEVKKNYQIELQALDMNEQLINRTYVELRENACDTFAMNEDVYMSPNSNAINVYTFAGDYDVAANVLSINNHIVPVGYNVRRAGSFTFSMPSNFDGTVTLIDTYTGTRTNLALDDYTVSLPNGVNNDRFLLEININQAPTAIDGTDGGSLKDGNAHKYIENGVMYILENGNLYDARGNRVR